MATKLSERSSVDGTVAILIQSDLRCRAVFSESDQILLEAGIACFNAGHYWEAHEQWEAVWLLAQEPERSLLQGLIQAAAALVHWQRGNRRGLWRNWMKARPRLIAVMPIMYLVDQPVFVANMDAFVHAQTQGNSAQSFLLPGASIEHEGTLYVRTHPGR